MTEKEIISDLLDMFGAKITSADVRAYSAMKNISYPTITRRLDSYKVGHGKWNLEITSDVVDSIEKSYNSPSVIPTIEKNLVPEKDPGFVSFGCFSDIKKIISSNLFYPVFITGLSGNGKTMCVEQACAHLKRELIRFNVTVETDSDDLIGGFRLQNGDTVWHNGPVVEAMQRGAVLLLDECLDENEKVLIGTVDNYSTVKLSELEYNTEYPVVSFNMQTGELENDAGSIISDKEDELYEVELEDGKVIKLNAKHPFIVMDKNGDYVDRTIESGLSVGDSVICFS